MSKAKCIIFDCDGVLIDSEIVTNRVEAELKSELGFPITLDQQLKQFVGLGGNHPTMINEFSRLPENYRALAKDRIWASLKKNLRPTPHALNMISGLKHPYFIASNSILTN